MSVDRSWGHSWQLTGWSTGPLLSQWLRWARLREFANSIFCQRSLFSSYHCLFILPKKSTCTVGIQRTIKWVYFQQAGARFKTDCFFQFVICHWTGLCRQVKILVTSINKLRFNTIMLQIENKINKLHSYAGNLCTAGSFQVDISTEVCTCWKSSRNSSCILQWISQQKWWCNKASTSQIHCDGMIPLWH